jgi:hypothetical protein
MLTKRGYSLVHAAAISYRKHGALFTSRGGGGKTTIALEAVERRNYGYLGDNYVICKDGRIFSYFSDLNMFGYNIRPFVWEGLTKREQRWFRFWLLVYRFSRGYIKIFSPVSPMRIFPEVLDESTELFSVISLLTGEEFSSSAEQRTTIIERIVSNQKLEFYSFVRHADQYACVYPESDFSQHWKLYKKMLCKNFPEGILYNQLTMPREITTDLLDNILADFKNKVDSHLANRG